MKHELNHRQELFCRHVAAGKNASIAYRLAGFSAKHVHRNAWRLTAHPECSARIAALKEEFEENPPKPPPSPLDRSDILNFLAEVILTPPGEVTPGSPICQEYEQTIIPSHNHPARRAAASRPEPAPSNPDCCANPQPGPAPHDPAPAPPAPVPVSPPAPRIKTKVKALNKMQAVNLFVSLCGWKFLARPAPASPPATDDLTQLLREIRC